MSVRQRSNVNRIDTLCMPIKEAAPLPAVLPLAFGGRAGWGLEFLRLRRTFWG